MTENVFNIARGNLTNIKKEILCDEQPIDLFLQGVKMQW